MKAKLILGGGMVEVEGTPAELRELLKLDGELLMATNHSTISSSAKGARGRADATEREKGPIKSAGRPSSKGETSRGPAGHLGGDHVRPPKKCKICGEKKPDVKWGRCQECRKNALGNQKKSKKAKEELGDLSRCKRCGKEKDLSELHRGRCKLGCKPLTKEEEEYETPGAEDQVTELLASFVQALLERKTPEDQVLMEIRARAKLQGFVILDKTAKKILKRIQTEAAE